MTSQAGWHPDPVPPQPGQPAQLRYWDGTRWTEHTAPAVAPSAAQHYAVAPAYGAAYGAPAGSKPPATTPDGVPLAGWWVRVLAYVLDTIVLSMVVGLLALPWINDAYQIYRDWFDELLESSDTAGADVDTAQLQRDLFRPLAFIVGIQLAVGFCYHVGFLMWKQGTPGKLLLGLRVRLRERPGSLPFGTAALRWLAQFGVGVLGLVPFVGSLSSLYTLLDHLWPLWDDKKQAIHDKVARTNVVRVR